MTWSDSVIRWLIPASHRADPTKKIGEVLDAQENFLQTSRASAQVVDDVTAGIDATAENTKLRRVDVKPPNPEIRAARDALRVLERRQ
jgi:hypothetical protein